MGLIEMSNFICVLNSFILFFFNIRIIVLVILVVFVIVFSLLRLKSLLRGLVNLENFEVY